MAELCPNCKRSGGVLRWGPTRDCSHCGFLYERTDPQAKVRKAKEQHNAALKACAGVTFTCDDPTGKLAELFRAACHVTELDWPAEYDPMYQRLLRALTGMEVSE